jgi:purine-nucleoside phosphorylase
MSVVPEVLAARQMQVRVLGLAAIANRAAGLSRRPVRHDEVLEEGANMARNLVRLLDAVLPKIAA